MLRAPPDDSTFKVNVGPPKLADGTDPVSRLVREHEGQMKPPVDLAGHPEKRLVLLLGKDDPCRVLLSGRLEAPQRVRAEERAALLVLRLRRPVEDRDQEPQVVFDGPVGHRPPTESDASLSPRPDEPIPVAAGTPPIPWSVPMF